MKKAILIDTRYAVMITYVNLPENPKEMYQQSLSFLKADRLEFIDFIGDDGECILAGFNGGQGVFDGGQLVEVKPMYPTGMYLITNDDGDVKFSVSQVSDWIDDLYASNS
jgi:hypothetical protein